jgi:peptide/nickel transport system substrate-binding protein
MRRREFFTVIAGGATSFLTAPWELLSVADAQSPAGGMLRFGMPADVTSLDPIIPSDNPSIYTMLLLFDQLVRTGPQATTIEPGLASSWDISQDGKTYTFHLRPARFSDGSPVSAEDVVYSLDRARGPESRWASFFKPIASVRVAGERTVVVTLQQQFTPFLANLCLFSASIVPRRAVEAMGKGFSERPVGSGPFVLERWDKGSRIVLVKNPHYWQRGKPRVGRVSLEIVTDDNTRMLRLVGGDLDVAANVPLNQINMIRSSSIDVRIYKYLDTHLGLMNNTRSPFTDVRVRQALNYAVDKQAIIRNVLFGVGTPAPSYLPPVRYYDSSLRGYAYDPDKARALLKDASLPSGFSPQLLIDSGDSLSQQVAVILQDMWKKVGVSVKITPVEAGTHESLITKLDYDIALWNMSSDTIDPDQLTGFAVVNPGRAKAFYTGFRDDEVNRLFEQGRTMPDGPARARVYSMIQRRVMELAPFVFLFHLPNVYAIRKSVRNFSVLPTGNYRLEDVSMT